MERYLRFYIKYHGYVIAVLTILFSILLTLVIVKRNDFHYPLEEFYDYRFMGSAGLIFGVLWFGAGATLLYGIIKEIQNCIYPFALMYMLELLLLLIRELILVWQQKPMNAMVFMFLDPIEALVAFYITLHIAVSLLALEKLFKHEPLPRPRSKFVRINTNDQRRDSYLHHNEELGDEISLVAE